jgi:hypothetical protein
MQMSPNDLNDEVRRVHRQWTIGFAIVYGTVALMLLTVVAFHPAVTTEMAMKVEGIRSAEATGSIAFAAGKAANK